MKYIYHIIPNPFVGTKLIPLNEMDKESELYKGHARKYLGRESLTKQQIPILNCLWNDVVQFSAINPQLIVDELKNLNPNFQLKRLEYFKISLDEISSYDGVIFDRKSKKKGSFEISEDEVKLLNKENYAELFEVPLLTKEYWKNAIEKNQKVLWFPHITHIFLRGQVETKNFEICQIKL